MGVWPGAARSPSELGGWPASISSAEPDDSALVAGPPITGSTLASRRSAPSWFRPGDLNGFLGLGLDNTTQLVILSGLLIGVFKFPAELVLTRMVPGTALGVLAGNLAYTGLAVRLMRATGRDDVTAMPFGIDTPTLFAMVFGVLGPVMATTHDPVLAWKVGMAITIAIGLVKTVLAFAGDWVRRLVPRAALLGSIAGIAVVLIAFLPSLHLFADPLVGLVSLVVLFLALFGGARMPLGIPGAFAAVVAGATIFWVRRWLTGGPLGTIELRPWALAIPWPTLAWLDALPEALPYLSIAIPFALVTVVGGIDNTESAAAAGDGYRARDVLMTEALATVLAGVCGGVIQNTPYIGHPAYKSMGARAGYTLATGIVIGAGAATGVLSVLVGVLPEAAVAPILIFIGLEITAQGFLATPPGHGVAVAVTFVPVVAALVQLETSTVLGAVGKSVAELTGDTAVTVATLATLGNGFVLTALVWGSALVAIVDRRFRTAALVFALASAATLFGLVHSPLPNGALFWPWALPSIEPARLAGAYGVVAGICWFVGAGADGSVRTR